MQGTLDIVTLSILTRIPRDVFFKICTQIQGCDMLNLRSTSRVYAQLLADYTPQYKTRIDRINETIFVIVEVTLAISNHIVGRIIISLDIMIDCRIIFYNGDINGLINFDVKNDYGILSRVYAYVQNSEVSYYIIRKISPTRDAESAHIDYYPGRRDSGYLISFIESCKRSQLRFDYVHDFVVSADEYSSVDMEEVFERFMRNFCVQN